MSFIIKPYEARYSDTLIELAIENYHMERKHTHSLQKDIDTNYFSRNLKELFSKGTCKVALEDNDVVGFLAFDKDTSIATSPLYGYGINHTKRGEIISKLFQSAASILCENHVEQFWINVYAHDLDVLWTYIMSAFAMDVTDVVRDTNTPILSKSVDYEFREIDKSELSKYKLDVIELYRNLINHLRVSPVFYHCKYFLPIEDRFEDFLSDSMRMFAVFDGNKLIGMVNAEPPDNGFTIEDKEAVGLIDLLVAHEYRRNGIGVALLDFANQELKKSGVKRIFVTHGTINPTARGFWDKYFTNYSYTMMRQIDPDMLGVIQSV